MLKIENLSKSYGKNRVLQDINLSIQPGEIYGLLGPNGAGKTTTINIICNLVKPDRGTIKINQQNISRHTKYCLGVAPQENLLYQSLTCQENLFFYGRIYGLKKTQIKQRIKNSLEAVKLLNRANTPVEQLSGGMQRRMNIAVALIHQPKLLILDEPTTGLDIEARWEIWQLIKTLRHQGITILLTTHLLDEAQRLCERIGIIKQGQIIAEGSLAQLKKLVPAQEIVVIKTSNEAGAITRIEELGLIYRRYGNELTVWLNSNLELSEIIYWFNNIAIDSIARQSIQLEHIYAEVTQNSKLVLVKSGTQTQ